eukprot:jgi/Mesvir1/20636/Mv14859-RA.1
MGGSLRKSKKSRPTVRVGRIKKKQPKVVPVQLPGTNKSLEWDPKQSLEDNYARLGLATHSVAPKNSRKGERATYKQVPTDAPEVEPEAVTAKELDKATGKAKREGLPPRLTNMQRVYVGQLVAKYGEDVEVRDRMRTWTWRMQVECPTIVEPKRILRSSISSFLSNPLIPVVCHDPRFEAECDAAPRGDPEGALCPLPRPRGEEPSQEAKSFLIWNAPNPDATEIVGLGERKIWGDGPVASLLLLSGGRGVVQCPGEIVQPLATRKEPLLVLRGGEAQFYLTYQAHECKKRVLELVGKGD